MSYQNASPGIRRLLDKQATRKCEHCGTIGCDGFASPYCKRCCSKVTRCGSPTGYYPKLKDISEELRMMQHVLLKNGNHPGVKLAQSILADAITACHNGHTLLKLAGPVIGGMYIEPRGRPRKVRSDHHLHVCRHLLCRRVHEKEQVHQPAASNPCHGQAYHSSWTANERPRPENLPGTWSVAA